MVVRFDRVSVAGGHVWTYGEWVQHLRAGVRVEGVYPAEWT